MKKPAVAVLAAAAFSVALSACGTGASTSVTHVAADAATGGNITSPPCQSGQDFTQISWSSASSAGEQHTCYANSGTTALPAGATIDEVWSGNNTVELCGSNSVCTMPQSPNTDEKMNLQADTITIK
jgi:hypothetical protein